MRNEPLDAATWGQYVKAARKQLGMSGPDLAREIGVERSTVYRWETAGNRPENGDVVARFAKATGRPLDEALAKAGLRPDNRQPPTEVTETPLDPRALAIARDLQIVSDRLYAPDLTDDERIQIETQLNMLVDLARQVARQRAARRART